VLVTPNLLWSTTRTEGGRYLEVQQLKVEGLGGLVGKEGPHAHQASLLPLCPFRAGHIDLRHPSRKNLNHQNRLWLIIIHINQSILIAMLV
jgi:hypothetical protein